jgi:ribosomal protein S6--L-glutamate ligase
VKASAAEKEVAIQAARVLGLGVAGVDLIRSKRGPLVLEVNASPGLEGIEEASGVDVAGEIVDYVAQRYKRRAATRAAKLAAVRT